jgi:hypothetical protein
VAAGAVRWVVVVSDRLGSAWREYANNVIPLNATAVQASECRRAFYAGASAMLTAILSMLSPGDDVTAADLTTMEELHVELIDFATALKTGRA